MGILAKIEAFLDGKKTYIVSIIGGLLGLWVATGHIVPEYVWVLLGAAGLGSLRSSIGPAK